MHDSVSELSEISDYKVDFDCNDIDTNDIESEGLSHYENINLIVLCAVTISPIQVGSKQDVEIIQMVKNKLMCLALQDTK